MIEALNSIDRSFFLFLNSLSANWLDPIMTFLSGQLIWLPMVVFVIYNAGKTLGARGTMYFALFLVLAIIASDVTSSYVLKNLVGRLRPCRDEVLKPLIHFFGQKCGGRFGFVSSHAANSFALVVFSIRVLNLKPIYCFFGLALAILVGYSRIYLGVHYPGDIFVGSLIGASWALFLVWAFKNIKLRSKTS